jgi:anthranilate/para-aminobenzoate synthase component I
MALLYSGMTEAFTGSTSYLFVEAIEARSGSDWRNLPALAPTCDIPLPVWVGYLGYGMRDDDLRSSSSPIDLPDFQLVRYAHLFCFDHEAQHIDVYAHPAHAPLDIDKSSSTASPAALSRIAQLSSNFSRSDYGALVEQTVARIHAGDFYQANITRKFFGQFESAPDSWQLFTRLTAASPAPYSAYIRHGGLAIVSSSPECFLTLQADGTLITRPIKGSARRSDDAAEDTAIKEQLRTSTKNHAENLMIVDLMRNDLARVSETGSVAVVEQSVLYSYRTIHHLISTIRARKKPEITAYEAVRACFPAGSMTGAPKIAAMHWCTPREGLERGVYSGVIGWFGHGQRCDLSVVIRTLIVAGDRFEFQVGGGIVADSTADDEWRETLTKARGILSALGLDETDIANI